MRDDKEVVNEFRSSQIKVSITNSSKKSEDYYATYDKEIKQMKYKIT